MTRQYTTTASSEGDTGTAGMKRSSSDDNNKSDGGSEVTRKKRLLLRRGLWFLHSCYYKVNTVLLFLLSLHKIPNTEQVE